MSPGGIPSAERFPAKLVCLRGYGLHVRRIDAASHSAEMVDLEIARNLANEVLVREPVRSDLTGPSWRKVRAVPKVAVALVTDGSRPEPATRHRLRYDLLHEAFSDRSLGPTRHAPILAILADDYPAPLAAWRSLVARPAHNRKVARSNRAAAPDGEKRCPLRRPHPFGRLLCRLYLRASRSGHSRHLTTATKPCGRPCRCTGGCSKRRRSSASPAVFPSPHKGISGSPRASCRRAATRRSYNETGPLSRAGSSSQPGRRRGCGSAFDDAYASGR